MADLIEPKEIELVGQDGKAKRFIISKFSAFDGREFFTQYSLSALPKLGDYKINEEILQKMLCYVAVPMPNGAAPLRLSTREVVGNHVPDWELLAKIELALMQYNTSFFYRKRLDIPQGFGGKAPSISSVNIDNFLVAVISDHQATLRELKTVYSLEDAWIMWEVIAVTRYNEYLASEHRRKEMESKRGRR